MMTKSFYRFVRSFFLISWCWKRTHDKHFYPLCHDSELPAMPWLRNYYPLWHDSENLFKKNGSKSFSFGLKPRTRSATSVVNAVQLYQWPGQQALSTIMQTERITAFRGCKRACVLRHAINYRVPAVNSKQIPCCSFAWSHLEYVHTTRSCLHAIKFAG